MPPVTETTTGLHWAIRGDAHLPPQVDPEFGNALHPYAWSIADGTELTATLTDYVANGVVVIPNAQGAWVADTQDLYTFDAGTGAYVWTGGASGAMASGTATHLAQFTAANALGDTAITYDNATKCITFPLPPSPGAITGILESTGVNMLGFFRGPDWIQMGQAGSPYASIIYGLSETPTNDPTLRGGALVSTGYWDADVDGGLRSLVIPISYGLLTGSGTAYIARDHDADTRFFQVQCYADSGTPANDFVGVKVYGSNGAALYSNLHYDESGTWRLGGWDGSYAAWGPVAGANTAFIDPQIGTGEFDGGVLGGTDSTTSYNKFKSKTFFSGVAYWGWIFPDNIVSGTYNDYQPVQSTSSLVWGPTGNQGSISRVRFTEPTSTPAGSITGNCVLTGLVRPNTVGGDVVYFTNHTAFTITLKNNDAGSNANNRFYLGRDVVLEPNDSIVLMCDSSDGYLGWFDVSDYAWKYADRQLAGYLPLDGSSAMTGTLNMDTGTIDNVGQLNMVGDIAMGGNKVTGLGAATTAGDAPQLQQLAGRLMVRI